ncbi:ABC transporter substrate-binding protein [Aquibacillus halophilus]|uniref:ABC transporter substrate-binding protein n=2 Tax=Aquibacillus halophilus TaxID=930132 RepID=A0A6A8DMQ2_9BACI|nr:ABC transporter substrate-binding protein [Aquibacillus halophilus]
MKTAMIFFLILITFLVGCGSEEASQTDSKTDSKEQDEVLKVFTTLYPIEDFVNKIGGSHVEVVSILPAGTDPHTYEPTSKTLVDIAEADVFFYNGAGLEAYAEKIIGAIEDEDTVVAEAAHGVNLLNHVHDEAEHSEEEAHGHDEAEHSEEEAHGHDEAEHSEEEAHGHDDTEHSEEEAHGHDEAEHGEEAAHGHDDTEDSEEETHDHGDMDPHVWLDPIRAITLAENITETLISVKPELAEEFTTNFNQLKLDLEELDKEFHNKVESKKQSKILVAHAAYGYWEKAYGIEQIAITGISPSNEPSHKELERVITKVKENNINYIFFEQNVTPKVAEVIQNEVKVEPLKIHNLSVLTEEDIENNEDYFSLMYKNIDVLVKALAK